MAKGKGKGKGKKSKALAIDPRIKALRKEVGYIWQAAAGLAAIGGLLQIIGVASNAWLIVAPFTLRYQGPLLTGFRQMTQEYGQTNYGLYLTYFNQVYTIPWYQRVSTVCGGYSDLAAAAITSQAVQLWDSTCSTNCVGHFQTRCNAYKQLATLGYVACAGLIGGACLNIVGAAWLFVFGKSKQFLQFGWASSGLIGAAAAGYWLFSANLMWSQLGALAFWPSYSFGSGPWVAFSGCALSLIAGLMILVAAAVDSRREWKIVSPGLVSGKIMRNCRNKKKSWIKKWARYSCRLASQGALLQAFRELRLPVPCISLWEEACPRGRLPRREWAAAVLFRQAWAAVTSRLLDAVVGSDAHDKKLGRRRIYRRCGGWIQLI
eukprot:Gregarina_sp_Poly_1__10069@NODE_67_length_16383_cov_69_023903_g57_i0_p4_GENE_NODE_67_length_16383_cov_69_023903_g57_i0NODE_67_length_16383_cov_69_023903_g57_i0_p4_ORF_typecomplete_len377_score22_47_NODE_67_length_16383_cov_69_023903_g57_i044235553